MIKASVVIPAHNAQQTLDEQLEGLCTQTYDGPWELIVVDDHSTDQTMAIAEQFRRRLPLRTLRVAGERGVNRARNLGVAESRGDLIALCDADDVCAPGWLEALLLGLNRFDVAGGCLDETVINPPRARGWRPTRPQDRLPVALGYLPYAVSANMGVRRRVWEELSGFDQSVVRGGSEIDFSWRAQEAGYKLGYVPEAVVHYRLRTSLKAIAGQAYWYGRGDVRLARSRSLPRPLKRPFFRLVKPPEQVEVGWWRWTPGRIAYASGYGLGTVSELMVEAFSDQKPSQPATPPNSPTAQDFSSRQRAGEFRRH